jgi:hypothetical protein
MSHSTPSFTAMKFRLWRRRLSVSSPKLAITPRSSWPMRFLGAILFGVVGAAAMWAYDSKPTMVGALSADARAQLVAYKERIEKLGAERDEFSATVNAAESQMNIERAAQKQLAVQVKTLEAENTRLKEDLAFFESLLPNATGPEGVAIRRLKIDPLAPNQLRYRLLVMQGGKGDRRFAGSLQLVITSLQNGKSAMMTFPEAVPAEQAKFKLNFMHYQRVEGVLTLPEGAVAKAVQARVLENGQVRAQLAANL